MKAMGSLAAEPIVGARVRARLTRAYRSSLPLSAGIEPALGAALRDCLDHPGSLSRAQIAWAVGRNLGLRAGVARDLAIAVEYFHTASLVFDDLPSMDDAEHRRGRLCVHRVWGEATASLTALAFVTRGYALLWSALQGASPRVRRQAATLVEDCLGVAGILTGQARDLGFSASAGGAAEVVAVADGKTVSLIRLTLLLPALVGGGKRALLGRLERLAVAWGRAYQALDDAKDACLTDFEAGKSTRRDAVLGRPSLVRAEGWRPALARIEQWLSEASAELAASSAELDREAHDALRRLHQVLAGQLTALRDRGEARRLAVRPPVRLVGVAV